MIPYTADAYRLLMEGSQALAQVESNGIRIDTDYLDQAIATADGEIKRIDPLLRHDPIYETWRRQFGSKTNLGSAKQLGTIIFDVLGHKRKYTGEGSDNSNKLYGVNSEGAFEHVKEDFLRNYFRKAKFKKAKDKLEEIQREVVNGYLHCFFNLHTARSYRSSADTPNFTSIQSRNEELAKLIRMAFVARKGYQLVENDFGGMELRGIACYTKDEALIEYLQDKDIHLDFAMACYKLKRKQVTKLIRHAAKNKFVFPNFYGSYYIDCARGLWDIMVKDNLKLDDGTPLRDHLRSKGITKLGKCDPREDPEPGTFEEHVKETEEKFWDTFHESKEWREQWWDKYAKKGYIKTLTGFLLQEVYKRNQVVNIPVQGSMFHCCLQTLIWMNKWLKKKRFRSRIVGEIHDSIIGDVHPKELDDYLHMIKFFATVKLQREWKWIILPLEIEAEVCPVDGTWWDKKKVDIP